MASTEGLTTEQRDFWAENGYLIIPNALSPETVDELLRESHQLLEDFSLDGHPMTKFTTGDDASSSAHVGDNYFLTSHDQIRFFFETAAFSSSGVLLKPKTRAINKIGHGLHLLSPAFRSATLTRGNLAIARDLGFSDPRVLQSMVICKQPEIGGAVPSHQDSTFLYTNPPSAVGFWYALEDCTESNGCLSFAPGSHRRCEVKKRFVRMEGGGTGFEDVQSAGEWSEEDETFVLGPVERGSLVLIHGNVLHKSERNTGMGSRFIYTFHVIEGENKYDEKNWLQPTAEGFSRLNDVE
ncbi:hypothetical protein BZA05DRAFT_111655 [Tricharina praecox]|uniref:uncharacterized protein n=1 Tax=Tricharina praecox TaxID=43433 RepID=UPI00221EEB84|nr:uncharacterized protein BZA05DRAFT_111655 [Tricharina praecox]KAI5857980.1 hypothetical protein BZA05DRAFT_111655 [Tricharina praecox]